MAGSGILVVGNTNTVSIALKKTLEQAGYNVLGIAISGAEAVEKALTLRPDIILMDILLEGSMDGIEAAKIISGQFDVPIIYVSENLDDSTFARALASDAWGFLSKPTRPGDIRYTIELALKRKSAESRLQTEELGNRDRTEFIETLLESANIIIMGFDTDGRVTLWNKKAEENYGYPNDEVMGRSDIWDALFPDKTARKKIFNRLSTFDETDSPNPNIKSSICCKSGENKHFVLRSHPIPEFSFLPAGFLVFGIDITEQETALQNLRESEGRFSAFMDNIPGSVYIKDEAGRNLYFNQYMRDHFGADESWKGKTTRELFPASAAAEMEKKDRKVLAGEFVQYEETVTDITGEEQISETRKFPIHTENGTILIGGFSLNVTERVLAESRLLRAVEAAHMGVWDWDLKNNTIEANDEWFSLFRVEPASCPLTSTWFIDQVHPDDRLQMERKILETLETTEPFEVTFRFLCGDGVYRWTKGSGATTKRDREGRPLQASGVNLDVDEIMHQRRKIEHQAVLLKQAEDIAGVGIIEYDANTNRIFKSAFFSALWDDKEGPFITYEEMIGHIHPEDRESFCAEARSSWEERRDANWIGRILKADMTVCWMQGRWHHLYHPDGTADHSVGMATDITALHETEEKLRTTLEERSTLLKEVHHRVKNNLQILLSMVVLEEMKYQEELTTNSLAQLLLTETSSRIAAIANIHESLYQTNDFSGIPFREHLETIADDLFITGHFKPGMITCDVDGDDIQVALDQAVPLSLTVNEILINCRKHAFNDRETGRVTIRTHDEPDTICVCIADDGIGIPEGIDPATADSVGLSLIHRIVTRQLNGTAEVKNRNGTVWTIRVPKVENPSV